MIVNDILQSVPTLKHLLTTKLNFNTGYQLQKLVTSVDEVTSRYESLRTELMQSYGVLNEEAGRYDFSDENLPVFEEAMEALQAEEVDLVFTPISASLFVDVDIEPGRIRPIMWALVD